MAAVEVHHRLPVYLLRAHEDAVVGDLPGAGQARLEWEEEAARYGVPADVSREELRALVEGSTVEIPRERHRGPGGEHSVAGDWSRWGRRGGRTTFERYGAGYFRLLAMRRWNRVRGELLREYRAARLHQAEGVS